MSFEVSERQILAEKRIFKKIFSKNSIEHTFTTAEANSIIYPLT